MLPTFYLNMEGYFKKEDLRLCDAQYTIRHMDVNCFVCGEKVFLKSNPEHPMTVHSVNKSTITTIWYTKTNEMQLCEFPPECILQYKYAGLITYRQKLCVSLN
jgi:DNA-directed RNA polymerase subunit RPC12/RpoP